MNLIIRSVQVSDAAGIYRINMQEEVLPYMIYSPSQRLEQIENRLRNLAPTQHEFVAVLEGQVAGYVGLNQGVSRRSHHGELFIAVDAEQHGKGIGSALLTKMLDLTDNWLMMERVELGVLATNPGAKALYERFGFVVDGNTTGAIKSAGAFVDEIIMARLRPNGLLART